MKRSELTQRLAWLRGRFRAHKERLAAANHEKLRRLGHLALFPLVALLLTACSSPASRAPAPAPSRVKVTQVKADPAPVVDPAPAPAPAQQPQLTEKCSGTKIQGLPSGATLGQTQLLSPKKIQGKKVTFHRGGGTLSVPLSNLSKTLHRFIAEHRGARNFPEERAVISRLERLAPEGGHITLDDRKATWFSGSPAMMQRRINFLLADLLAAGSPVEVAGSAVELVLVEYSSYCGELCGAGGRAVINAAGCELLFYTVDWLS